MDDLAVSQEFIDENLNAIQNIVKPSQKFSQYTKKERQKRRSEVFRLHVDLGYSAVKISDMMKINRNTINQDIKWCYQQIQEQFSQTPEQLLDKQLFRYETQRMRLVSSLTLTDNLQEKLAIEKIILEIDSKIATMMLKIKEYQKEANREAIRILNEYLDKNHKHYGFPKFAIE